jgi:hypothetical protein
MACKKHLEARLFQIEELTETEVYCGYDCDGNNQGCSGYDSKSLTAFDIGIAWAKSFYDNLLSITNLQKMYRAKKGGKL